MIRLLSLKIEDWWTEAPLLVMALVQRGFRHIITSELEESQCTSTLLPGKLVADPGTTTSMTDNGALPGDCAALQRHAGDV